MSDVWPILSDDKDTEKNTEKNTEKHANINTIDAVLLGLISNFPVLFTDDSYVGNIIKYVNDITQSGYKVDVKADVECRVRHVISERLKLQELLLQPQVEQRSEEWYEMRRGRLTASAIDQSLDIAKFGKTKKELVISKAFPMMDKPFDSMSSPPLRHGIILEDMTARCYSQRLNNIKIYNFGMIAHPTMKCFGASPDGINELGIMVEIKTPYRRRVDGNVPYGYMLQMQGQMAVCGLSECDFVDAMIKMDYRGLDSYIQDAGTETVDHGVIVEYIDATDNNHMFDYSPENLSASECIAWGNERCRERNTSLPLLPWKLKKIMIKRIKFDTQLWNEVAPKIEAFWEEVETLRAQGIESVLQSAKEKEKLIKGQKIEKKVEKEKESSFQFLDSDDET